MHKIWVIMRKEWNEVFRNRLVLFTVVLLPLLLTALPLSFLIGIGEMGETEVLAASDMPESFGQLCGDLGPGDCGSYFLVSQFLLLFMILPLAIPATIASYSIVGEKITRTLEPLLATPVSTLQLLGGKSAAAMAPAVLVTWICFGVFMIGVALLASPEVLAKVADPMWFLAIFIEGPLLSLAAVSAAVMVSSRTSEPRVAEQVSMLIMLPLMAILIGQVAGVILLNAEMVIYIILGTAVVDAGLVAFAINLFQRETILTRWK